MGVDHTGSMSFSFCILLIVSPGSRPLASSHVSSVEGVDWMGDLLILFCTATALDPVSSDECVFSW